ncbi:PaaX family transcriptional regulator [Leucobacter weissii]|uniref:PaaX family transcriptional regulator n=1 Tax=Leucobacter weissii TaxID=1983706 RepID=A0A939MJN7_9MICO|nr:PaaX family transcriptional regulator C-terminal domain-containing protein [Leucobacter weissii]MBO1902193.1 PaaX family transcriptional regulator [Leucobacter weissii]
MSTERPAIAPRTIVEALLPAEGPVALALIHDTANAAGVEDQPLRLCVRRMAAAGEILRIGRGRGGSIALTEAGRARLRADRRALALALAQDRGLALWDGRWRLLAASAPEAERGARDLIRRTLLGAGAAAVSTGLFVSPHDLGGLLDAEHEARLVRATATEIEVGGESDPLRLVETLWPRKATVAGYAQLERMLEERAPAHGARPEDILVAQLRLAEALERALRPDPLIPPELRGDGWAPARVRREWRRRWATLTRRLPDELLYRGWLPPWTADAADG